ncbi:SDR family oxidoreductase [Actinomadura rudentiformis]|uniref:SDR family oxidoreductase n=1 Tax=Actinomadura rudentiformis TaxID=359158 RepID=A0A6H9YVI4_9ACTN|nr:SDR family oxidoreductase [Actinomadura rudentiformis]KAB2344766.1 SDR family oxidoreductase [Actinomadura rudentiformis]
MATLEGKTALVTGASRGIGRAIAERLAADGALVAVNYARDEAAAKEVVAAITTAGGRAFAVQARLGTEGDVDTLFAALDPGLREHGAAREIDILVNNAGVGAAITIEDVTPALYDEVFAVNTRATFFTTQRALSRLRDGGRIINITTGATRIAFPEAIAYAMTKGAIDTFTLALAQHLGPRGITVNNVAPGIIDTDMNADWLRGNADAEAHAASRAALGRVGRPDDVAAAVAFLASADGRWVTGTTIDATGGSHL